ncbi:hypothetical protein EJB05_29357, partial [Eragrostis curvula]
MPPLSVKSNLAHRVTSYALPTRSCEKRRRFRDCRRPNHRRSSRPSADAPCSPFRRRPADVDEDATDANDDEPQIEETDNKSKKSTRNRTNRLRAARAHEPRRVVPEQQPPVQRRRVRHRDGEHGRGGAPFPASPLEFGAQTAEADALEPHQQPAPSLAPSSAAAATRSSAQAPSTTPRTAWLPTNPPSSGAPRPGARG